MRWLLFAASAAVALGLWLPGEAASPATPTVAQAAATGETISFEQYREWRLNQIERQQAQLAARLAVADLPQQQKARLLQIKAYYDWLAGLSDAERDRRFHERFDRIDTNHDGQIDEAERAAWHDKQSAFYHRDRRTVPRPAAQAAAQ